MNCYSKKRRLSRNLRVDLSRVLNLNFAMKFSSSVLCLIVLALFPRTGCADGFRFIGGDAEAGKIAFENLNCVRCHRVPGVAFEKPKSKRIINLSLGEEVRFVKSYEDILTAITNPRHVIKKQYSKMLAQGEIDGEIEPFMPNLIEDMSAGQLINLVTFLDKVYSENLDQYSGAER